MKNLGDDMKVNLCGIRFNIGPSRKAGSARGAPAGQAPTSPVEHGEALQQLSPRKSSIQGATTKRMPPRYTAPKVTVTQDESPNLITDFLGPHKCAEAVGGKSNSFFQSFARMKILGDSEAEVRRTLAGAIVEDLTAGGRQGVCQELAKAKPEKGEAPFVLSKDRHRQLEKKFADDKHFKEFLALQPIQQKYVLGVLEGDAGSPERFDRLLLKIAAKCSGGKLRVLEWIPAKRRTARTFVTVTQAGEVLSAANQAVTLVQADGRYKAVVDREVNAKDDLPQETSGVSFGAAPEPNVPDETLEARDERRRTLIAIASKPLPLRSEEDKEKFESIKEQSSARYWAGQEARAAATRSKARGMSPEFGSAMEAATGVRQMFSQLEAARIAEAQTFVSTRELAPDDIAQTGPSTIVAQASEPREPTDAAGLEAVAKARKTMDTLLQQLRAKMFEQQGLVEAFNSGGLKAVDCAVLSALMGATGILDENADMDWAMEAVTQLPGYDTSKVVYSNGKTFDMKALAQTLRQISGSNPDEMLAPGADANKLFDMVNQAVRPGQPPVHFTVVSPYATSRLNAEGDFEFEVHANVEKFGNSPPGPDVEECAILQGPFHYQTLVLADKAKYAEYKASLTASATG
jgi:hypothetical protein